MSFMFTYLELRVSKCRVYAVFTYMKYGKCRSMRLTLVPSITIVCVLKTVCKYVLLYIPFLLVYYYVLVGVSCSFICGQDHQSCFYKNSTLLIIQCTEFIKPKGWNLSE